MESVHVRMSIKVYEGNNGDTPLVNEVVDVKRDGDHYLYTFGSTDMLLNKKYIVVADRPSKEILCTKRSLKEEADFFSDPFRANMDSILLLYQEPEFISKAGNTEHYRLFQKQGVIKQIDVFIDGTENVMRRLEYRYKDQHYVVIAFTVFDKAPGFNDDTFSEGKYFYTERGELKASKSFPGFNVVEVDSN